MSAPLGLVAPALLAQCPEISRPEDADALPIHITEWGNSGPSVLMVHGGVQGGIGGGPTNFLAQKSLTERNWRLRLLDRPGFGGSPSRGPDDMTEDAVIIAEQLGDGAHLIGHSFGGAGALLAAARRPDAVRSLILIEPALQPLIMLDPAVAGTEEATKVNEVVLKFILEAKTPGEFALNFARSMSRPGSGDNPSYANIANDPDRATALGCALLRARGAAPQALKAAADGVRAAEIPVMVVSGGYNAGQEITAKVVARATGGKHEVVPCDTHFVQQDNPEGFNAAVDAFMRAAEVHESHTQ